MPSSYERAWHTAAVAPIWGLPSGNSSRAFPSRLPFSVSALAVQATAYGHNQLF